MKYSPRKDDLPAELPTEEQIAERAYSLWEKEGRNEGSQDRHWFDAERMLREELAREAAERTAPTAPNGEISNGERFQETNPYSLPKKGAGSGAEGRTSAKQHRRT